MKNNELVDLTDKALREELVSERQNLTKLTLSHAVSPLENPMRIRTSKKRIARIQTELKSRVLKSVEK